MKPHLTGKQIVALRDGEAADADASQHLETCELCMQELQSASSLANLLAAVGKPAGGEMLFQRVGFLVAALAEEVAADITDLPELPRALPLELIHRSRSIGLLRVGQGGDNVKFEYSPLEIGHSFLETPPQTFSVSRQIGRFAFTAGEFRFTVEADDESGRHLRIHIDMGSDFSALAGGGLEVTLIDCENAPRIFVLGDDGSVHLELRSTRSILLLHSEPSAHLGIELSADGL
jgi:hypothetical protein